jgi:hypothetical protein
MKWILLFRYQLIGFLGFVVTVTQSFDYQLSPSSPQVFFDLTDVETGISNIKALFIEELTNITVRGISWVPNDINNKTNHHHPNEIVWTTYVNGIEVDSGSFSLVGVRRELPTQLATGSFEVERRGMHNITVRLVVDDSELIITEEYNSYNMALSILPLIVVLLLAIFTNIVSHK